MSMRPIRYALTALVAVSLLAGCNKEKTPAASAPAAAAAAGEPSPDTVVATFGDQKITFKDLNERIKEPLANLEKQKHQLQ